MEDIPKNETTNAVLKEMIIGLTKITDDRLLNLKEGVSEIKTLVQGFVTKVELEDVKKDFNFKLETLSKNYTDSIKRIEDAQTQHNKDDAVSFGKIDKKQDKLQATMLLATGGLIVIVFVIQYIIPLYWK